MTPYIESFRSGWHVQRDEDDHGWSRSHCGLTIIPRNVWTGLLEVGVCAACRDALTPNEADDDLDAAYPDAAFIPR